jgi:hypothetical protein
MPLLGRLPQSEQQAGGQAARVGGGEAGLRGDAVGGLEAHPAKLRRQPEGIPAQQGHGAPAVAPGDAHGQGRADAVAVEEDHDLPQVLLGLPGGADIRPAPGSDAGHLGEALDLSVDDLQGGLAEARHDALGHAGPDALDQAGAQVAPEAFGGHRHPQAVIGDAELGAEGGVPLPLPLELQFLAGAGGREGPHHRDGAGQAVGPQPGHGETALGVGVGDAFDPAAKGCHGGAGSPTQAGSRTSPSARGAGM